MKSKLSTAKESKTTIFSRVFHPKKIDNFIGKSKLDFWTKNEDFEQCEYISKESRKGKNLNVESKVKTSSLSKASERNGALSC